jgi:4'-phosphopantetheinyl transferase EntD
MFAFTVRDEQAATDVARAIATEQRNGGLKDDDGRALQGVTVLGSAEGDAETVYRAVYVLYHRIVFFEVFGSNHDAVLADFDSLLNEQVTYAPPTVR